MKHLRTTAVFIYCTGFCVAFLLFSFFYRFAFNYEVTINDHYYLVGVLPFFLLLSILYHFRVSTYSVSVAKLLWLLVTVGLCGLLLYSKHYSFGNEYFVVMMAVYFISSGFFLAKSIQAAYIIITFFLALYFYQLYTGLLQLSEAIDLAEANISLLINGTLNNSGVYACYLVIHFPFLCWAGYELCSKKVFSLVQNKICITVQGFTYSLYRKVIMLVVLLLISTSIALIIITQSRTAYISLAVMMLVAVLKQYGGRVRRFFSTISSLVQVSIVIGFACITIAGGYYLFAMKKMSAVGRMMKINIAWGHITDHFWLGTGIGRFTWYYPQWQEQYFKNTPHPPNDFF